MVLSTWPSLPSGSPSAMRCPAAGGGAASRRDAGPRLVFAVLLLLLSAARGESSPAYFERGQVIPVWVNSIRSPRRMDSVPMSSTPFCLAEPSVERPLSWAQRLAGDRLLLSPIAVCHCVVAFALVTDRARRSFWQACHPRPRRLRAASPSIAHSRKKCAS